MLLMKMGKKLSKKKENWFALQYSLPCQFIFGMIPIIKNTKMPISINLKKFGIMETISEYQKMAV